MRLLADMHISPRTVQVLRQAGHDVVRVDEILPSTAADEVILARAREDGRGVLTQDLDFTNLVALGNHRTPSVITLRLRSSRVEHVNEILSRTLSGLEHAVNAGAVITIDEDRIRQRALPLSV